MKFSSFISGVIIFFAFIYAATVSANAQCVPDTLTVTSVSGRVIAKINAGETPLGDAIVRLIKGGNDGPVIAKQAVKENGGFSFKVKSGNYQLKVSVPHLSIFYVDLEVRRSKAKDEREIIVIMGVDFRKECSGSSAELRLRKIT